MHRSNKGLVAVISATLVAGCAAGEVTVGGRVVDWDTGEPLAGVRMYVGPPARDAEGAQWVQQTTTGPDGRYRMVLPADLPDDRSHLLLLKEGYDGTMTVVLGVPVLGPNGHPIEPFKRKAGGLYEPIKITRERE